VKKSIVFWVLTLCSLDIQAGNQQKKAIVCQLLHAGFLLGLLFNLEDEGGTFL
jgi:hypothetical protein